MLALARRTLCRCLALSALLLAAAAAEPPGAPVPTVTVQKEGNKVAIDVRMTVPVPQATAWEVMTDFTNMARFVPNLSSSEASGEAPNQWLVRQKGTARWGLLSFDFESIRRIVLQPMSRIDSTTVSGKVSKMLSWSELAFADNATSIHYHADAEIDFWLPPGLGTRALRHEAEEQFGAMAAEMLRRAGVH